MDFFIITLTICRQLSSHGQGALHALPSAVHQTESFHPNPREGSLDGTSKCREVSTDKSMFVKNPTWLSNDLCRRIDISPLLPKISAAEAGTISSNFFTEMLLEDSSNIPGGFSSFLEAVKSRVSGKLSPG